MADPLYTYYEHELSFLRQVAVDFADKYPAVAERLKLDTNQSPDPHVERLIEACAFLAARVHLRLDEDFPELADALLGILYPHYLAPVPSMTVVQFEPDPDQVQIADGVEIDRHKVLYLRKVDDVPCRFRTAYPVRLWPVRVEAVDLPHIGRPEVALFPEAKAAIRLQLRTVGGAPLSAFNIDSLRFYLDDTDPGLVHTLYETMLREPLGLLVRPAGGLEPVRLEADAIRQVGFAMGEGLLEYPRSAALGYRLLQEYFAFPDKYHFVELTGLDCMRRVPEADSCEILIMLPEPVSRLEGKLRPENFKLGCTPAVNLFPFECSPIRLDHRQVEYPVIPDQRAQRFYEVYSVQQVEATTPGTSGARTFRPFYAIRHGDEDHADPAFWHSTRRRSVLKGDDGTDVYLSLVDPDFGAASLDGVDVLHVRALCTNRDLPSRLVFGDPQGDFTIEGVAEVRRTRCLRQPTKPFRPHLKSQSRWRLVSHLSLNHLSLGSGTKQAPSTPAEARESVSGIREILRLYDVAESAITRQRIEGLVGIQARRVTRMLHGVGAVRGVQVTLDLDEAKFSGTGVYLFASVLERFLALYTTINSFTVTEARVQQREGTLKRWPPRIGEKQLL